jgi:hypothetical protein
MPTKYFVVAESQLNDGLIQELNQQIASGKKDVKPQPIEVPSSEQPLPATAVTRGSKRNQMRGRYKTFSDRVEDLKKYKAIHGHVNVKIPDDKSLSQFCANARYARKNPGKGMQLTEERIAALDSVGFDWETQEYVTKSFEERLEDLNNYKAEHGHVNVRIAEDQSLGQFCANVRYTRRRPEKEGTRKLTEDRIAKLDALGFEW